MNNVKRLFKIFLGGIIILIGCIVAPLPGPGGVPIILVGLAMLATEFVWAKRLMDRLKRHSGLVKFNKQNRMRQVGIIVGVLAINAVAIIVAIRFLNWPIKL